MSLLALALAVTGAPACTDDAVGGGGGGEGGAEAVSLSFVDQGTLELLPLEERTIALRASPGAVIRLYLLGNSHDASINKLSIQADGDGEARFTLRAPGQPAAFRVRATVGEEAAAELSVAVSENGFSDLRVTPAYAGSRELDGWTANVLVGASCAAALETFPEDPVGALRATSEPGADPIVESVPVGPRLAVLLRAGAAVSGCTETTLTAPGTAQITVDVSDRPAELGDAELEVGLDFEPEPVGYAALVDGSLAGLGEASWPEPDDVAAALLDAMHASLVDTDEAAAFAAHRSDAALDAAFDADLMGFSPRAFTEALSDEATALALADAEGGIALSGKLASAASPGEAHLTLSTFGDEAALDAGFAPDTLVTWSVDASDTLLVAGTVPVSPHRFAGRFLERASVAVHGQPLAGALAEALDCAGLGTLAAFGTCDATCATALCETAVAARLDGALAETDEGDGLGALEVVMSGTVEVDELVVPIAYEGSWVGTLAAGAQSVPVEGAAQGEAPSPE